MGASSIHWELGVHGSNRLLEAKKRAPSSSLEFSMCQISQQIYSQFYSSRVIAATLLPLTRTPSTSTRVVKLASLRQLTTTTPHSLMEPLYSTWRAPPSSQLFLWT